MDAKEEGKSRARPSSSSSVATTGSNEANREGSQPLQDSLVQRNKSKSIKSASKSSGQLAMKKQHSYACMDVRQDVGDALASAISVLEEKLQGIATGDLGSKDAAAATWLPVCKAVQELFHCREKKQMKKRIEAVAQEWYHSLQQFQQSPATPLSSASLTAMDTLIASLVYAHRNLDGVLRRLLGKLMTGVAAAFPQKTAAAYQAEITSALMSALNDPGNHDLVIFTTIGLTHIMDVAALTCIPRAVEQCGKMWLRLVSQALSYCRGSTQTNAMPLKSCIKAVILSAQRLPSVFAADFDASDTQSSIVEQLLCVLSSDSLPRDIIMMASMAVGYWCTVRINDRSKLPQVLLDCFLFGQPLPSSGERETRQCLPNCTKPFTAIIEHIIHPFVSGNPPEWSEFIACGRVASLQPLLVAVTTIFSVLPQESLLAAVKLPTTSDGEGTILFEVLLPCLYAMCHPSVEEPLRHTAFQFLRQWMGAVVALSRLSNPQNEPVSGTVPAALLHSEEHPLRFSNEASSCLSLLETVLLRDWEDPNDKITDAVRALLAEILKLEDEVPEWKLSFSASLTEKLCHMDWRMKGRYRLLTQLAMHRGSAPIEAHAPLLHDELYNCCLSNTLSSSATSLYLACIKNLLCPIGTLSAKQALLSKRSDASASRAAKDDGVLFQFDLRWAPLLLRIMISPSPYIQKSISTSWVTKTFKLIPSAFALMAEKAATTLRHAGEGKNCENLRQYVLILSAGRRAGSISAEQMSSMTSQSSDTNAGSSGPTSLCLSKKWIQRALTCGVESIRLSAFDLICRSVQTTAEVADVEIQLAKVFLSKSLASTSNIHRLGIFNSTSILLQRLLDSYNASLTVSSRLDRKVAARLRNGLAEKVQRGNSPSSESSHTSTADDLLVPKKLQDALDNAFVTSQRHERKLGGFLLWLIDLCLSSLAASTCYQRRLVGMKLLLLAVNSFSKIPTSCEALWENWNDMSYSVRCGIMPLLEDNYDDIRGLASSLLIDLANRLQRSALCTIPFREMVDRCTCLIDDPRSMVNDAGVEYVRVFVGCRTLMPTNLFTTGGSSTVTTPLPPTDSSLLSMMQFFTTRAERQLASAKANLLVAAKNQPIQGTLLAMNAIAANIKTALTELPAAGTGSEKGEAANEERARVVIDSWRQSILSALRMALDVIKLCCGLLGGSASKETEHMPSFEDLGTAIIAAVEESNGDVATDDAFVMSFAWVNIKNAASLCATLVSVSAQVGALRPLPGSSKKEPLLVATDQIIAIKDDMVEVLQTCRHRGVIESVAQSLFTLSHNLATGAVSEFRGLSMQWLAESVKVLQTSHAFAQLSVTRRSAGLPHIIHSLALTRAPKSMHLHSILKELVAFASATSNREDAAVSELIDVPQIHAYNVLKALFAESTLNSDTNPFISDALVLTIGGFSSPIWGIRNSSLQLFGVLLQRLFGGSRRDQTEKAANLTISDFIHRYPHAWSLLAAEVSAAASRGSAEPYVFAALTLFSRLRPATDHTRSTEVEEQLLSARAALTQMLHSPLSYLRVLSAKALLALIPSEDAPDYCLHVLSTCLSQRGSPAHLPQNALHGNFLLLRTVVREDMAANHFTAPARRMVGLLSAFVSQKETTTNEKSGDAPMQETDHVVSSWRKLIDVFCGHAGAELTGLLHDLHAWVLAKAVALQASQPTVSTTPPEGDSGMLREIQKELRGAIVSFCTTILREAASLADVDTFFLLGGDKWLFEAGKLFSVTSLSIRVSAEDKQQNVAAHSSNIKLLEEALLPLLPGLPFEAINGVLDGLIASLNETLPRLHAQAAAGRDPVPMAVLASLSALLGATVHFLLVNTATKPLRVDQVELLLVSTGRAFLLVWEIAALQECDMHASLEEAGETASLVETVTNVLSAHSRNAVVCEVWHGVAGYLVTPFATKRAGGADEKLLTLWLSACEVYAQPITEYCKRMQSSRSILAALSRAHAAFAAPHTCVLEARDQEVALSVLSKMLRHLSVHLLAEEVEIREVAALATAHAVSLTQGVAERVTPQANPGRTEFRQFSPSVAIWRCYQSLGTCVSLLLQVKQTTEGIESAKSILSFMVSQVLPSSQCDDATLTATATATATATSPDVLFQQEDINPYAEGVRLAQLAFVTLVNLLHPGVNNFLVSRLSKHCMGDPQLLHLDHLREHESRITAGHESLLPLLDAAMSARLAAGVRDVPGKEPNGDDSFMMFATGKDIAATLLAILVDAPGGVRHRAGSAAAAILPYTQVLDIYKTFLGYSLSCYIHIVGNFARRQGTDFYDWADITAFNDIPGLQHVLAAWQARPDLHGYELLRSAASLLSKTLFVCHKPAPSGASKAIALVMTWCFLAVIAKPEKEDELQRLMNQLTRDSDEVSNSTLEDDDDDDHNGDDDGDSEVDDEVHGDGGVVEEEGSSSMPFADPFMRMLSTDTIPPLALVDDVDDVDDDGDDGVDGE